MLPDRVSNPGPLTYESGALPIALRGPAIGNENALSSEDSLVHYLVRPSNYLFQFFLIL